MTVARPFAIAAFEYARDHDQLSEWQNFLSYAAAIASNPYASKLFSDPEFRKTDALDLFRFILAAQANEEMQNFIHLLLDYNRITSLPEILNLYNLYRENLQKICTIRIVSATAFPDDYKSLFAKLLSSYTKQSASLHFEVDPSLIGGAIIYIGDTAIDGSVRGKLDRMLQNLIE